MPVYEFDCKNCNQPFEQLLPSLEAAKTAACPACGSRKVEKRFSAFATQDSSLPDCESRCQMPNPSPQCGQKPFQ